MNRLSAMLRALRVAGFAALALCFACAGIVMAQPGDMETEGAVLDNTQKNTQQLSPGKDTRGIHSGDRIWFGTNPVQALSGKEKAPVSWLVLDPEGMLLLSEEVLGKEDGPVCFDGESPYTNLWKESDAKAWCGDFFEDALTKAQKEAVLETTRSDAAFETVSDSGKTIRFDAEEKILDRDHVFFLSAQEVERYLPEEESRIGFFAGIPSSWWLRSPVENSTGRHLRSPVVGIVTGQESSAYQDARAQVSQALGIDVEAAKQGDIRGSVVDNTFIDAGMRPAMNLDLSRVLFASPVQGQEAGETAPDGLHMVQNQDVHEWKLTITDPDLSVTFEETKRDGDTITISYRDVSVDEDAFISAAVLDQEGILRFSGRLAAADQEGGSVTLDLSGISVSATDRLFLFLQAEHGAAETDYAGGWTEISLGSYTG